MAKKKSAATPEELVEILKFTPCTYRVEMGSYGGEIYIGKVNRSTYNYFKKRKIDMEEYAVAFDEDQFDIPEKYQPFPPGSPYECDNLIHASGATMDDSNVITVYNEKNDPIWQSVMELGKLEEAGVVTEETEEFYVNNLKDGTVVFYGAQGEKGSLFGGEFELKAPFDPKKLKLEYTDADGWYLCSTVIYDGENIDNNDYGTNGKWGENKWIIVGGEEVYESEPYEED